jgi:hypothetical protein
MKTLKGMSIKNTTKRTISDMMNTIFVFPMAE